jgi:CRISPR/Cas system CMR-associated protein Cmr1 (group 7 of RAMP superfamily)
MYLFYSKIYIVVLISAFYMKFLKERDKEEEYVVVQVGKRKRGVPSLSEIKTFTLVDTKHEEVYKIIEEALKEKVNND